MSRRDYIALAEVFRKEVARSANAEEIAVLEDIVDGIAQVLQRDNPRFSWDKFTSYIFGS